MTRKRTRFRFSFPESKHGDFVDVDDASPFDEAVSDSLSRACLETASSLLPTPLRDLKPRARSCLDRGRDDHIDGNPMKRPPLDSLHPLDRLSVWIAVGTPVMTMRPNI
jgi:hypothetical protein